MQLVCVWHRPLGGGGTGKHALTEVLFLDSRVWPSYCLCSEDGHPLPEQLGEIIPTLM